MKFYCLAFIGVTALASVANAAPVEIIQSPSGDTLVHSKCKTKSNKCMAQAAKACNGPYQVIDSESHAGGLFADLMPGPITWYSMTVQCGKSDGAFPKFEFRGQSYQPPSYVQCNAYGGSVICFGN